MYKNKGILYASMMHRFCMSFGMAVDLISHDSLMPVILAQCNYPHRACQQANGRVRSAPSTPYLLSACLD